ncbi:MAG TPA: alkaline phosphatase family protein [Longimicrobium sp.]|jgi:hypothetical protein|uniref:alkaline phosphatase family protein n=1 Tax=Longimicrobium sp. TaxID=2029185 RepID=UPI002ED91A74
MRRRVWIIPAVAALVVAGGLWHFRRSGGTVREMAELVAQGGEKLLREPLRPARPGPRVLVLALDGVGESMLRQAIAGGRLPHLSSVLGAARADSGLFEHGWSQPGVLSILPSTTYAAWASLFTGAPAGETGVPGNEWFAREERRFYAPAPVSVTQNEDALQVYTDQLMGRVLKVPTLYERAEVRSYVSLQAYHRGADLLTVPEPERYGAMVGEAARGLGGNDSPSQEAYEELDVSAVASLLGSIRERGVADLQVIYFPGVDLFTHVAPNPLQDQLRYLGNVVDRQIGAVLQAYRQAGALDDTWIVVVADHGHTPVLSDDLHALGAEGADEPPEVLRQAGFRTRALHLELEESEEDFQSVVAYQGAFAYVYLADRSACPRPGSRCDWSRPPRMAKDVLPVVRAFDAANRTGAGVPQLRGALDLILAREPRPAGRDALPFQVWNGTRLVPVGDWLRDHPRPELLDLERRLAGLAAGPYGNHAGDVLLLARTGMHLPLEQRYYFSGRYQSWHGSPTRQDSEIPLLVARVGMSGTAVRDRVQAAVGARPTQLSVTPLILNLLAAPAQR